MMAYWRNGPGQKQVVSKSAGSTRIHSSISASFRFTRHNIYCIGQAGLNYSSADLPYRRMALPASKPVRTYVRVLVCM